LERLFLIQNICLVYDTGGLALKRPADKMFLMKTDMGNLNKNKTFLSKMYNF
jgi:hypothetical protein